ncbi:MAG: cupin domain-containing protein, partial [Sedimenticolaceae bacterium]
ARGVPTAAARAAGGPEAARVGQILEDPSRDLAWQSLRPGIEHYPLTGDSEPGGWARLFRFQPGVRLPRHSHGGEEYALVLQGSYVDESGRFSLGDFSEADASLTHEPIVDSRVACIALIAATGGIRFENPMYRAASRLFGL